MDRFGQEVAGENRPVTSHRYDDIRLVVGDHRKESIPLDEIVGAVRQKAAAGDYREAHDRLLALIEQVLEVGPATTALELLAEHGRIIPSDALMARDRAWILNVEGLIRGVLGQHQAAIAAFEQMRAIGETLHDEQITAVSLQNLGLRSLAIGDTEAARQLSERSLAQHVRLNNYRAETQLLINLASIAQSAGDLTEAEDFLKKAGQILRTAGDPHLHASLYGNLGRLAAARGDFATAEGHYRRAYKDAQRSGDGLSVLISLQNLGAVHLDQGRISGALRWYRKAIRLGQALEAVSRLSVLHRSLALALHRAGRYAEAAQHFDEATRLAEDLGDRREWAKATADRGAFAITLGDIEHAGHLLTAALTIFQDLGDADSEARTLSNLAEARRAAGDLDGMSSAAEGALAVIPADSHDRRATILRQAGDAWLAEPKSPERAVEYFERAVSELAATSDATALAWENAMIGAKLSRSGARAASLSFFERAMEAYRDADDAQLLFHTSNDYANALSALGRYDEARRYYGRCLELAADLQDRAMELQASLNLGETARRESKLDEAIDLLEHAVTLARSLDDPHSEGMALGNLGIALSNADRWQEANASFQKARALALHLRDPQLEATAIGGLAGVAFVAGRHAGAARLYRRAARLRSQETLHTVEDVAGLSESLAALGRTDELQQQVQRMVDIAQRLGAETLVSDALCRVGRWYLKRGDQEEAASIYAIAIVLAAERAAADDDGTANTIMRPFFFLITHARMEQLPDEDGFYESVLAVLDKDYDGLGATFRWVLDLARDTIGTVN